MCAGPVNQVKPLVRFGKILFNKVFTSAKETYVDDMDVVELNPVQVGRDSVGIVVDSNGTSGLERNGDHAVAGANGESNTACNRGVVDSLVGTIEIRRVDGAVDGVTAKRVTIDKLVNQVLNEIAGVVDVDLIEVLVAEGVVVGTAERALQTLNVDDKGDVARVETARLVAAESIKIGVIRLRHLRCSRRFRVRRTISACHKGQNEYGSKRQPHCVVSCYRWLSEIENNTG